MSVITKRNKWKNKKSRISYKINRSLRYPKIIVFRSNRNISVQLIDNKSKNSQTNQLSIISCVRLVRGHLEPCVRVIRHQPNGFQSKISFGSTVSAAKKAMKMEHCPAACQVEPEASSPFSMSRQSVQPSSAK